jgi:hypothetical protein
MTRREWRAAWRAARLFSKRYYAGSAAIKRIPADHLDPVLTCWREAHEREFGITCIRRAMSDGFSGSYAKRHWLRAVRYRVGRGVQAIPGLLPCLPLRLPRSDP